MIESILFFSLSAEFKYHMLKLHVFLQRSRFQNRRCPVHQNCCMIVFDQCFFVFCGHLCSHLNNHRFFKRENSMFKYLDAYNVVRAEFHISWTDSKSINVPSARSEAHFLRKFITFHVISILFIVHKFVTIRHIKSTVLNYKYFWHLK